MRLALGCTLAVLAGFSVADAAAPQLVQFVDGRTLAVAALEPDGEALRLSLEGGGTIVVPARRVAGWRPLPPRATPAKAPDVREPHAPWRTLAGAFAEPIARAARSHRLDPVLLTAMAQVESAFDPVAVSPKGALGLLQLMPATAARFGVEDAFDVAQNVEGGARYLRWLLERFEGDTELALAGYNSCEAAVERHNGIPPFRETRAYVTKVLAGAARLRQSGGAAVSAPAGGPGGVGRSAASP